MAAKTLRQLATRLNEIIAENDKRGWSERNDLPAAVELVEYTPTRKIRTTFYEVNYISSAKTGVGTQHFCGVINVTSDQVIPKC